MDSDICDFKKKFITMGFGMICLLEAAIFFTISVVITSKM